MNASEQETLYGMDEAIVMFPHERAASASKAKYIGWQELDAVGMVSGTFYPVDEFSIPHYAVWDDGSEYEVFWGHVDRLTEQAFRRYHGPVFGRRLGAWKGEEIGSHTRHVPRADAGGSAE